MNFFFDKISPKKIHQCLTNVGRVIMVDFNISLLYISPMFICMLLLGEKMPFKKGLARCRALADHCSDHETHAQRCV